MPGIFSRLKTWVSNEVLTYSDLNAEFDNIINNAAGDKMDGTSHNLSEMQQTEDPAPSGTPDLVQPISITDEIRRLRYAVSRIIGKTNWYDAPSRNLENFYYEVNHMFAPTTFSQTEIASQLMQSGFYDSASFVDNLYYDSSLKKFAAVGLKSDPSSRRFFVVDPGKMPAKYGTITLWFRNVSAGETILHNPGLGLRVYVNGSGYIACDLTLATAASSTAKTVQSIATGTTSVAGLSSFSQLVLTYRIENLATDKISLYLNGTQVGSTASGPFNVNSPNRSEHWFLNGSSTARTQTSILTNSAVPGSSGWTKTTTGGTEAVSSGVLQLDTVSGSTLYYSNTPPSTSSNGLWFEFKIKLNGSTVPLPTAAPSATTSQFSVTLRTASDQKAMHLSISPCMLSTKVVNGLVPLAGASGVGGFTNQFAHDFHQWTTVTVETVGSSYAKIYINGMFRGTHNLVTDATAGSTIVFGDLETGNPDGQILVEYFSMGTSGSVISANSLGGIIAYSDIALIDADAIDATTLAALQTASPFSVFGSGKKDSPTFELGTSVTQTRQVGFVIPQNSTSFTLLGGNAADGSYFYCGHFYSDGKTPVTISGVFQTLCNATAGTTSSQQVFITVLPQAYATYGVNGFGVPAAAGGLNSNLDAVPSSFSQTYSGGFEVDSSMFKYSSVFPAGFNKVNLYYRNTSNNLTHVTHSSISFNSG